MYSQYFVSWTQRKLETYISIHLYKIIGVILIKLLKRKKKTSIFTNYTTPKRRLNPFPKHPNTFTHWLIAISFIISFISFPCVAKLRATKEIYYSQKETNGNEREKKLESSNSPNACSSVGVGPELNPNWSFWWSSGYGFQEALVIFSETKLYTVSKMNCIAKSFGWP